MALHSIPSRLVHALVATKLRVAMTILSVLAAIAALAALVGYRYITHGGMIARQAPPSVEAYLASSLLNLSIPAAAQHLASPLDASELGADLSAGRVLYQRSCEICHASDGRGRTAPGSGLYPKPSDLQGRESSRRSDGALFYLIRNGIRNTGMPGWELPDRETWQLVAYIRHLPSTVATAKPPAPPTASAHYSGSSSCRACHQGLYDRWQLTLMANVVQDPREHPDAIIPDLSVHDPLVNFTREDIAFTYGSKWKQRYFRKDGDDYYPLPAQWDVAHRKWKAYMVKDDWWVPFYPADNAKRPTGTTCDGCHSVNYDIVTKQVTEWNVGCEKCHGPGSEHVKDPVAGTILNPARLDFVQANDSCIQCHSQGRPTGNPIAGKYYDWPVGFHMGMRLSDFWKLEEHKLGETTFTHFADGTAHKNRMQGNDFVTSQMYTHGVTCFSCHDSHGSENPSMLRKPAAALCLDCHSPGSPNGPRAPTIQEHTHHQAGSAGNECIACHMPKIAQTIGDVNVRSHTFRFIGPALTESMKMPNACNACHADKANGWTIDVLKAWAEQSPWRLAP
jgi:predicted CXXCH cytochrome family protein